MMPESLLENQVIDLVADYVNVRRDRITLETTLFGDLGVDGDDGDEILTRFMETFSVDMTPIQPVHFGPEGLVPWAPIYWLVLWWRSMTEKNSTPESRARMIPIRIQDLVDSARAERWTISYGEKDGESGSGRS